MDHNIGYHLFNEVERLSSLSTPLGEILDINFIKEAHGDYQISVEFEETPTIIVHVESMLPNPVRSFSVALGAEVASRFSKDQDVLDVLLSNPPGALGKGFTGKITGVSQSKSALAVERDGEKRQVLVKPSDFHIARNYVGYIAGFVANVREGEPIKAPGVLIFGKAS